MDYKAEYELSEQENKNLRQILEWCAQRLSQVHHPELARLLDRSMDAGGVVEDNSDDDGRDSVLVAKLFEDIADHFSPVENLRNAKGKDFPGDWYRKADRLISECRAREGNRQQPMVTTIRDLVS